MILFAPEASISLGPTNLLILGSTASFGLSITEGDRLLFNRCMALLLQASVWLPSRGRRTTLGIRP